MKKITYLFALVVGLAFVFASCQKTTFDDKTSTPQSTLKVVEPPDTIPPPPPPPPPGDECETAYGFGEDIATCFIDEGFGNWGWTNELTETVTVDLYAGAGQCDLEVGTWVGTVTVDYYGDYADVTYTMDGYFTMDEIHFYIGEGMFPTKKNKPTVSPGQYTYKNDELGGVYDYSFTVYDLEGNDMYFIAHAVVCGF